MREHTTVEERKRAWAYKFDGFNASEFHGPEDFYWHGNSCCKWHAKAEGWSAWLAKKEDEDNG